MKPPTDRQVWEGEIANYWFEDGILVSLSKPPKRTVENIKANVALVKQLTNNKPVPLLIYLANSPVPDKETRKFSTEMLPEIYSAMAMRKRMTRQRRIVELNEPRLINKEENLSDEAK